MHLWGERTRSEINAWQPSIWDQAAATLHRRQHMVSACPLLSMLPLLCLLFPTSDTVLGAVPQLPGPPTMTLPRACPACNELCLASSILPSHSWLQRLTVLCFLPSQLSYLVGGSWLIRHSKLTCYLCRGGKAFQQKLPGASISVHSHGSVIEYAAGRACGTSEIIPHRWLTNWSMTLEWKFVSPKNS